MIINALLKRTYCKVQLCILLVTSYHAFSEERSRLKESDMLVCSDEISKENFQRSRLYFSPIIPHLIVNKLDPQSIDLGRELFFDKKLSINGKVACSSCHDVVNGFGVDGQDRSIGHAGARTSVNSPTVLNSVFQEKFFWNGRAETLEDQALKPIFDLNEMGMVDPEILLNRLKRESRYIELFNKVYPVSNNINLTNVAKSLANYQRSLVTRSRFDLFLDGNRKILNDEENLGLKIFMEAKCINCHHGVLLGGKMLYGPTFSFMDAPNSCLNYLNVKSSTDFIRLNSALGNIFFNFPTKVSVNNVCKVLGLRNSTKTGPYSFDGSVKSIERMVYLMFLKTLAREPSADEVHYIVKFLATLKSENSKP